MREDTKFPYKKGDTVFHVDGDGKVTKSRLTKTSPTAGYVRIEGWHYDVHVSYVGRTKLEAVMKRYVRDSKSISYSLKGFEHKLKYMKKQFRNLGRLETQIVRELAK